MKTYFVQDPLYRDRFSDVWLWSECAPWRHGRPISRAAIRRIDLVAAERGGGYCAIQRKCYAPGTYEYRSAHLDSFIAASAREPFTARIVIDTGDEWGPTAAKTIAPLTPPAPYSRFGDLASRPIDWPDLVREAPEALSIQREPFRLRPHQQAAFDDVTGRLRGAGSRQADHGVWHGQDLYRAAHHGSGCGRRGAGALSGYIRVSQLTNCANKAVS